MGIDRKLLENINDVLKNDLNSGMYDNFPKLKYKLERVKEKLVRFMTIINSEALQRDDIIILLENDYIDR